MLARWLALSLALLCCCTLWAADPAEKTDEDESPVVEDKGPPADPEIIRLHLMDGSVISGKLSVKDIEVETLFGTLTIPVTEVRSFTPGLTSHPDLNKKVYDLIDALASNDFDEREMSQKELLKMGENVRGELERRAGDADTERRTRIKHLLEQLDEQRESADDEESAAANTSLGTLIQRDAVETTEFTVVGKIVTRSFTVSSLYGPLTVKLADIRRGQRDGSRKAELRKTVTVDGTNLVQRGLKATQIRVEKGDRVTVTAEGSLTMTPWGNNAVSGPDGAGNFGWFQAGTIPSGALIASIGSHDNPFKVGGKSTFKAERSGVLKFGIGMQNEYANNNFPGRYNVKVKVERK